MAKKSQTETEPYLINDVAPKNAQKIGEAAKQCRAAQKRKEKAAEQEFAAKDNLLELIKKADLKPVDGKIKFRSGGMLITVTPREDAVKIKEEKDS